MNIETAAGYIVAVAIGLSLGLIGGGGSILTVPALVYLMHVNPVAATAYSLFIVGITSLVGSVNAWRVRLIDLRVGILFGIPSIVAVYLTRRWVVPAIPEELFSTGGLLITRENFLMGLFAIAMALASWSMIKKGKPATSGENTDLKGIPVYLLILLEGALVGGFTGLVGAGGGFLIIPALVLLARLPMKIAVGTSLLIIAAKSLLGFLGDLGHQEMDWNLLLTFSALSIGGIFIGGRLSRNIEGEKLKPAFGWFILVMGIYIFVREIFLR